MQVQIWSVNKETVFLYVISWFELYNQFLALINMNRDTIFKNFVKIRSHIL